MVTQNYFLRYVSYVMIVFLFFSCASENNNETLVQAPKITKESIDDKEMDLIVPTLSKLANARIEGRRVKMQLKASEAGSLVYSGNCNGDLQHVKQGVSEVSISFPSDGQYNDCEMTLSDASGNTSEPLPMGTIRIDATPPVLAEIKPVPKKIQTNRPSYSFKTSKTGTLSFIGKCKGNVDKAVVGINHIALLITDAGSYDDCTMTLTDSSNNQSQPLKISSFVVVEGQS